MNTLGPATTIKNPETGEERSVYGWAHFVNWLEEEGRKIEDWIGWEHLAPAEPVAAVDLEPAVMSVPFIPASQEDADYWTTPSAATIVAPTEPVIDMPEGSTPAL